MTGSYSLFGYTTHDEPYFSRTSGSMWGQGMRWK
jgi:hypothetical protein